ncbi:ATPase involved in DNA repair [Giardia duodenalis]|uniref:ATPase involved in DNA repair n=1 Tax=Giardia intestinalis TaxID=5741 RepID=V6THC2_GIAIN|nr:ATPase involved in DNA repair [Giardia intestinalis]
MFTNFISSCCLVAKQSKMILHVTTCIADSQDQFLKATVVSMALSSTHDI